MALIIRYFSRRAIILIRKLYKTQKFYPCNFFHPIERTFITWLFVRCPMSYLEVCSNDQLDALCRWLTILELSLHVSLSATFHLRAPLTCVGWNAHFLEVGSVHQVCSANDASNDVASTDRLQGRCGDETCKQTKSSLPAIFEYDVVGNKRPACCLPVRN